MITCYKLQQLIVAGSVGNTAQLIGNFVLCAVDCDHNPCSWHIYDNGTSRFSEAVLGTQPDEC